jgi:hypothetical protein
VILEDQESAFTNFCLENVAAGEEQNLLKTRVEPLKPPGRWIWFRHRDNEDLERAIYNVQILKIV